MMTMRRTAQGRLSEVFGSRTVRIDTTMRRFGLYTLARQSVAAQDASTRAALRAYSDGVNARLTEINEDALGRGAPEQFIFNAPIAPWQPADSMALIKLMSVQLSGHLANEVLFARTSLELDDPARLDDIMPLAPGSGIAALARICQPFSRGDVPADRRGRRRCDQSSAVAVQAARLCRRLERLCRRRVAVGLGWHALGE